jgi:alcohol dehydrogenase class IV
VDESKIPALTAQAFEDSCHATNPVPVTVNDLRSLYLQAL